MISRIVQADFFCVYIIFMRERQIDYRSLLAVSVLVSYNKIVYVNLTTGLVTGYN